MNKVVVHPERCVGCMQCMPACAVAHSQVQELVRGYSGATQAQTPNSRRRGPGKRRISQPLPSLQPGSLSGGLLTGSNFLGA